MATSIVLDLWIKTVRLLSRFSLIPCGSTIFFSEMGVLSLCQTFLVWLSYNQLNSSLIIPGTVVNYHGPIGNVMSFINVLSVENYQSNDMYI